MKVFILGTHILTGPIGSGKTYVQKILEENNFICSCADEIVRKLYKKNNTISFIKKLSPEVVSENIILLGKLRKLIFTDKDVMIKVENYIQPLVIEEFKNIEEKNNNKKNLIFIIPIIRNNNFFKKYKIIYLDSKKNIRINRLKKRIDYDDEMINNIIKYQETIDLYKNNNFIYIENNNSIKNLNNLIKTLINKII
ncbi:MAG: dephospho-CoA kinase [Gammaproteobacteria bacterium]